MPERETAQTPEDLTRLFVDRANAGDVDGLVELYEPDAVMAFPPGSQTAGHAALRELFTQMLACRTPRSNRNGRVAVQRRRIRVRLGV